MDDVVALAAGNARVEIDAAIGGALASFTLGRIDVLRPTPASTRDVRLHASYPLVPYSNRIAEARLEVAGRTHALARNFGDHPHAIHGVGWQRPWRIETHGATSALLMLDHAPAGDGALSWPWAFRAAQSVSLHADPDGTVAVLTLKLTIANAGAAAFPFGLGWHPFFVRGPRARLGFRAGGVWETDDTRLPTVHAAVPPSWRFDPARPPGNETIDNVFTGWDGEATLDDAGRHIAIGVRADRAAGFLVVYAPEGKDFLALEPVTHMTDAFNRAVRGERATGMRTLRPGGAFSCTMQIGVRLLP
ncbi:MAG: aldose 1-epimerase [Casimicrobiaceae bacterium]